MNLATAATAALHQRALWALQQGRESEAVAVWLEIVAISEDDLQANNGLGRWALRQGHLDDAVKYFASAAQAHGADPRHWINLALVHQRRGDAAAEEQTLFRALQADPQDLLALLLRGGLFERQGRTAEAVQAYVAATVVAPPLEQLSLELRPQLTHAMAVRARHEKALAEYVDGALATVFDAHAGEDLERFRLSLDIMLGRKQRFTSMPKQYFYPGLPPVEFFDRAQFPWLDAFEAGTDPVREEFLAVLAAEQGFTPYINYAADQPLNQWIQLNNSPDWSAYHLVKDGQVVGDHAARCPKTMALWSSAPAPEQPGRTPAAMFSLLSPRTRIPAHVGSSNMRLVVHLPLIVPAGCRFRVGNTIREWVPGQAWVFDDTIEHEAWNDSDALRVVLLFDIWHPALSTAERKMITALNTCINGFGTSRAGDFPL